MYQEKDTQPQTGVFMLVTEQMLEEYKRKETQPMTRLDKAMLIITVLFVLVIVILKLWS